FGVRFAPLRRETDMRKRTFPAQAVGSLGAAEVRFRYPRTPPAPPRPPPPREKADYQGPEGTRQTRRARCGGATGADRGSTIWGGGRSRRGEEAFLGLVNDEVLAELLDGAAVVVRGPVHGGAEPAGGGAGVGAEAAVAVVEVLGHEHVGPEVDE